MGRLYDIGPFQLDTEAHVLIREGKAVALGPRAVGVLAVLVGHQGAYVSKAAILDAAWPGLMVEEANLAVQVSAIRRALARIPGGQGWIETLPRRGYRFVGPVIERKLSLPAPDRPASSEPHDAIGKVESWPTPPHNLPERISSFIGRERDLAELKHLLSRHRLVSLVGIGGIGKTRVALQAATDLLGVCPDGVWLAELGAITDPRLVAVCVAQVLGLREPDAAAREQALGRHLRSRRAMLVLDTCEHVIDATAALVSTLLSETTHVRILVTSREALGIDGEQRLPLPALSLPPVGADLEGGLRSEAVRLFVERACLQRPDFALDEREGAAVMAICRALDGLPLAIELAAARVSALSIEEIHRRLADRFKLLEGGSRASPPRQRTLRATLDWSHSLLTQEEQRVLRRLAVFAGSFAADSARSVADDGASAEPAMVQLLSTFVARSVLVADTSEADTRYRLLDTTRAYLREKLDDAAECAMATRRHAEHFRDRFDAALEDWVTSSDLAWDAAYYSERDNIRSALDWAFSSEGDAAIGIAVAANSGPAWLQWSLRSEGLQRLEAAVARCDARTPTRSQARLWLWVGVLRQFRDPAGSVRALRRSALLHRRAGDGFGTVYALVRLASHLARTGRLGSARRTLDVAEAAMKAGSPRVTAPYFHVSGFIRKSSGDLEGARDDCEKALALYRSAGAERSALEIAGSLADTNWALGALDAALAGFREIVESLRLSSHSTNLMLGVNLTNLAGVLTEMGRLDDALEAAREGVALRREAGYAWGALDHLALRAALAGKMAAAARLAGYTDSAFAVRKNHRQPNEARARARLGQLLQDQAEADSLMRQVVEGAAISEDEACRLALND